MKIQRLTQCIFLAAANLVLSGTVFAADKPAELSETRLANVTAGGSNRSSSMGSSSNRSGSMGSSSNRSGSMGSSSNRSGSMGSSGNRSGSMAKGSNSAAGRAVRWR